MSPSAGIRSFLTARVTDRISVAGRLCCKSLLTHLGGKHRWSGLLRFDVGGLDHLAPGFELDLDALGELLRRAFDRIKVKRIQTLLHVRLRNILDNLAMEH